MTRFGVLGCAIGPSAAKDACDSNPGVACGEMKAELGSQLTNEGTKADVIHLQHPLRKQYFDVESYSDCGTMVVHREKSIEIVGQAEAD